MTEVIQNGTKILGALIAVFLTLGIYFIITEFVVTPSKSASKAILSINKKKQTIGDQIVYPIANKIVKLIHLSPERYSLYQKKIYAAELEYTPEFYVAKALALSIIIFAFGIVLSIITPIFFFGCIVLAVVSYFMVLQEADKIIREKSEKIQGELVLFASTIQTQLATSRDIIKIFESYRKICGTTMQHELDVTLADMKTGSYESALRRFESRLQSQSLSEIIRGLLGVLRGDDQRAYFDMLVHDLVIKERERLKRNAAERPNKIKLFTILTLGAIAVIIVYVLGYRIITSLYTMF
ncbi:MAG: hypothetical protein IK990_12025 [Ruminiclostridium sp.]|nr:hypothetical protein [Ruminiclostridium sp.]